MLLIEAEVDFFRISLQSGPWYMVLSKGIFVQEGTGWSGSDSNRKIKRNETMILEADPTPFHFMHAVGSYNRSPASCTARHTNIAEEAIHSSRMGSTRGEVLAQLSFQNHRGLFITSQ